MASALWADVGGTVAAVVAIVDDAAAVEDCILTPSVCQSV